MYEMPSKLHDQQGYYDFGLVASQKNMLIVIYVSDG